jgi:hypothetical protein
MNIEKLFTKETTIKINIVKIDNKKITKSVFNQINRSSPFDQLYNLKENIKFLGYINDKTKWIIWTNNEFLFKYEIKEIYQMSRINLHKNTIEELQKIYPSEKVKSLYSQKNEFDHFEYKDIEISNVLDIKEQSEILDKKEMVEKIISEILKRQIFL